MKEKELLEYLKDKAEEYWGKARGCILSRETKAWFEGHAEAYEDIIYQIEKSHLDG